jgi:hypothetical protein
MKQHFLFISLCFLGILSCVSEPETQPEAPVQPVIQVPVAPVVEPAAPVLAEPEIPPVEVPFDSTHVAQEIYDSTKVDVQQFIENLNQIIRQKDYRGWSSNLGELYLARINSREYLNNVSQQPRLKSQKIVLNSAEDYFINVVVPSRANDRVDDIEFVSEEAVRAYTVTPAGQRLRLYLLEKVGSSWKIVD